MLISELILAVIPTSALERTRRILNEPGDVPKSGKTSLPFLKRQQIIYLLNSNHNDKRTKQTTNSMETYAKELTPEGKIVKPHASKFLTSEDFHGGGLQEIAVNKGDGPPVFDKQSNDVSKPLENGKQPAPSISEKIATITKIVPISTAIKVETKTTDSKGMNDNSKETASNIKRNQTDVNASKKSDYPKAEDSDSIRVKNSMIRPYGMYRNPDGELILPAPKQIDPNLYEIGQSEVRNAHRYGHMRYQGDPFLHEPVRRWRGPGRWRHRAHYYPRRRMRPRVLYAPMYRGSPEPPLLSYPSAPEQPEGGAIIQPGAAYRNQVMLQPLSLPMVPAPQQPTLQNPLIQQADTRSVLYNVPIATAGTQLQQPVVYPIVALPTIQQPQQFVQVQPGVQPAQRPLASHWSDEQGHTRSEEPPRPPPDYDDDDRHDDDDDRYRYDARYDNEQQFHSDRDYEEREPEQFARDRWEDYPRPRPYMEEDPDARSEQPDQPAAPPPNTLDYNTEDDDDDDNEMEAYHHDLQDSKEPLLIDDGPPVIEREEQLPAKYASDGSRPIIPISSSVIRPHSRFMYPNTMSTDTFMREQLAGSPMRQGVFPRIRGPLYQRTSLEAPNAEMSEMSADEARFRERMRLELQAKDTIPRGSRTHDGLKNVLIRLNGEPLENASELRSRIVHGRVIPGKGKIIRSKGPMKIRVSHRGKGKHRLKIIDIFSPKKFNVVDSRSKILKAPSTKRKPISVQKHLSLNSGTKGSKATAKSVLKNAMLRNYNKQGTGAKIRSRTLINKINVIKLEQNRKPS